MYSYEKLQTTQKINRMRMKNRVSREQQNENFNCSQRHN